MTSTTPAKVSFKAQMLLAREDAIIQSVNRLLAEKGFEAMTVDQVAADVGIAKASLYKHFPSKEDLAAAAMVSVMRRTQAFLDDLSTESSPIDKLRGVVAWTMGLKLAGEMTSLPSQNSSLHTILMGNKDYLTVLMAVSDCLSAWIVAAQKQGALNPKLPPIAVLYTLYARACDPVLDFLKMGGLFTNDEIVAMVLSTCFEGLETRYSPA
jgi:TetR/AcrR family transcriptional regulator of autoinduction and epiphytic fitness